MLSYLRVRVPVSLYVPQGKEPHSWAAFLFNLSNPAFPVGYSLSGDPPIFAQNTSFLSRYCKRNWTLAPVTVSYSVNVYVRDFGAKVNNVGRRVISTDIKGLTNNRISYGTRATGVVKYSPEQQAQYRISCGARTYHPNVGLFHVFVSGDWYNGAKLTGMIKYTMLCLTPFFRPPPRQSALSRHFQRYFGKLAYRRKPYLMGPQVGPHQSRALPYIPISGPLPPGGHRTSLLADAPVAAIPVGPIPHVPVMQGSSSSSDHKYDVDFEDPDADLPEYLGLDYQLAGVPLHKHLLTTGSINEVWLGRDAVTGKKTTYLMPTGIQAKHAYGPASIRPIPARMGDKRRAGTVAPRDWTFGSAEDPNTSISIAQSQRIMQEQDNASFLERLIRASGLWEFYPRYWFETFMQRLAAGMDRAKVKQQLIANLKSLRKLRVIRMLHPERLRIREGANRPLGSGSVDIPRRYNRYPRFGKK